MAYHPNIPTPTGVVQDELAQMHENFQHLDPLAQAIGELQTVSGLAPVAGELQAVSELAPVAGELQGVSGLAPYVQAILDSRIVDHNLDVPNPPNGRYVRWENGLQIVWATRGDEISGGGYTNLGSISLPAAFVDANYAIVAGYNKAGWRLVFTSWSTTATLITPQIYNFDLAVTANWWYAAIGRWA